MRWQERLWQAWRQGPSHAGMRPLPFRPSCLPLPGGDAQQAALMVQQPGEYSLRLAEAMTGGPAVLDGFSPEYDVLLRAAPAAALTPEGVARGLALVSACSGGLGEPAAACWGVGLLLWGSA